MGGGGGGGGELLNTGKNKAVSISVKLHPHAGIVAYVTQPLH